MLTSELRLSSESAFLGTPTLSDHLAQTGWDEAGFKPREHPRVYLRVPVSPRESFGQVEHARIENIS